MKVQGCWLKVGGLGVHGLEVGRPARAAGRRGLVEGSRFKVQGLEVGRPARAAGRRGFCVGFGDWWRLMAVELAPLPPSRPPPVSAGLTVGGAGGLPLLTGPLIGCPVARPALQRDFATVARGFSRGRRRAGTRAHGRMMFWRATRRVADSPGHGFLTEELEIDYEAPPADGSPAPAGLGNGSPWLQRAKADT